MTEAKGAKKFVTILLGAILMYAVALVISLRGLQHNPVARWKYLLAALPVFPAVFIAVAVVGFVREMDEMQRKIQLEGLAFGFTATAVVTLSYGFLQNAGLPDVNWIWTWPVMCFCWMAGLLMARGRYL